MLGKHMHCPALTFLQLSRVVSPSEGSLPSESWVLEESKLQLEYDGVIRLSGRKWNHVPPLSCRQRFAHGTTHIANAL